MFQQGATGRRGRGRPKGKLNKRTETRMKKARTRARTLSREWSHALQDESDLMGMEGDWGPKEGLWRKGRAPGKASRRAAIKGCCSSKHCRNARAQMRANITDLQNRVSAAEKAQEEMQEEMERLMRELG